ncbi:hypothetical protein LR48_Vigan03g076600 [Vigna angularis]|uniref:Uncharacterized protein n=1 Tax=Phaseolus angularis TaxID=3914 RepID=A0A0L9U4R0_PHAAN|nr:hypothetical protein LR48_Vigan03g076600 [Vigna angularis]
MICVLSGGNDLTTTVWRWSDRQRLWWLAATLVVARLVVLLLLSSLSGSIFVAGRRMRNRRLRCNIHNSRPAYLSLPEGTTSVVGLIAIMTDHYNVLEESDSEMESNDALGARKFVKQKRKKVQLSVSNDQSQSIAASDGCLSLLKKRRLDGKIAIVVPLPLFFPRPENHFWFAFLQIAFVPPR